MAQRNARNPQGVRRQARAQGTSRKVNAARSRGRSLLGQALALLPFTTEQLQRAFTVLILAGAVALALFVADRSGAGALASQRIALMADNAGFTLRHVEVQGVERMNGMHVYERVLGQRNLAMTQVDTAALRADLLHLPWVQDARVSRQLPDVLVVDIIERQPHAVLRRADRLMLIDPTGVELEPVTDAEAAEYRVISGPGAQSEVQALDLLLDAAPALKGRVTGAEWVGNRRWNLTFDTDQRLALPEGPERAAAALISFAQADGVHRLIGGSAVAFDMRNPPRMSMRVPGQSDEQDVALAVEQP